MDDYAIEWVKGAKRAYVTFPTGSKEKNNLLRLKEEHPDEVEIIAINEDGSIYGSVPANYVKRIAPPRKMSESHIEALKANLKSKNDF